MSEQIHPEARPVVGFPDYMIDPTGVIWSRKIRGSRNGRTGPWHKMKLKKSRHGYWCCNLYRKPNKPERRFSHSLVAESFIGPRPPGLQVRHLDDVKTNNLVSNLAYGTSQQNHDDSKRNGHQRQGEQVGNAKLTNEQVREIRRLASKRVPHKVIAEKFGIRPHYVTKIHCREIWKKI